MGRINRQVIEADAEVKKYRKVCSKLEKTGGNNALTADNLMMYGYMTGNLKAVTKIIEDFTKFYNVVKNV